MKKIVIIFLLGIICTGCSQTNKSFWETKDAYFGQKSPGIIPEVFAPDIINHLAHSSPSFTPDGKEMYWSTVSGENETRKIFYVKFENNKWSEPMLANFSGNYHDDQPFISSDGEKLFFASKRPKIKNGIQENDIWISNKIELGWGDPKPIQNFIGFWTPTVTNNGTIYFLEVKDGERLICRAEYKNGEYAEIEVLNEHINQKGALNWCPFIALDESYLIFSSDREGNIGDGDLYISFKGKNGEWQEAINMGPSVNTDKQERFPGVSPDGKYLFFTRWNSSPYFHDIYWVSSSILEKYIKKGKK